MSVIQEAFIRAHGGWRASNVMSGIVRRSPLQSFSIAPPSDTVFGDHSNRFQLELHSDWSIGQWSSAEDHHPVSDFQ